MPTIVAFTGFEVGTESGIGAGGTGSTGVFDGTTGIAGTDFKVVAGTPVVGSYVGQVTTLNNKNFFWNTTTLGASSTSLVVSLRFMFSTLPTSANDFHAIDTAAGTDRAGFYYDPADQKIHAWILSVTQPASATIVANTWYTLQFRYNCSANPNTLDWTFNGTAQTSVSNGSAGATTLTRYALGNRGGTNGVINFDDTAVSVTNGDYPLPVYQVRLVGVDTAASTTQIGTANATVRFTSNGTLDGTHSSANILTALSELPPVVGATSSGVTQQTSGAGNAVEVPMSTYTLTGGETIAGCRLYVAGWAASATACNLGMRAWNGTAETTLHGDSACGFDAANIIWYTYLYAGVTNQTTLDALTVRLGYSTDVAPTPGAHAVYAELLILPGAGSSSIADVAGGGAGGGSTGPEAIATVLNDLAGGGAAAGETGPEANTAGIADLPSGGAGAGSTGPQAISTVLNDLPAGGAVSGETGPEANAVGVADPSGGGAVSGETGPELGASTLNDLAGGGAVSGGTAEAITAVLNDLAGGGAGAGSVGPETAATVVQVADVAGGGAGAGSTANGITTILGDLAGGGAAAGLSGPEGESAAGGPVALADVAGGGAASGATGPETATTGGAVALADLAGGGAVSGVTIEVPAASEVVHDMMVMPVLVAALQCLKSFAPIWPNAPQLFQVRPGNSFTASADSAFDECCAGVAWVRMGTMWPTDNFPVQKVDVGVAEETDWAVQVEFGIQRCIPTQGDDGVYGSVVTTAQWLAATMQETDDAAMLRKAACCLRDSYVGFQGRPLGNSGFIMGTQTPLENSGPCGGIMLLTTVRVPACDCADQA